MLFDFAERPEGEEWMDDFTITDDRLERGLRELPRLNRLFGGQRLIRRALSHLLRDRGRPVTVLDLGSGIGDLPLSIVTWAEELGGSVSVTASDANEATIAYANRWLRQRTDASKHKNGLADTAEPSNAGRIDLKVLDARDLPFEDDSFDIVIASQLLHHFDEATIVSVLKEMGRVSRRLVVVSDLHRNKIAWAGLVVATRILGFGPMVRFDGPLSVRKGFVRGELEVLGGMAGLDCRVEWRPLFRWCLTARPPIPQSADV